MASNIDLPDLMSRAALLFTKMKPMLPTFLHIIVAALFPIYTGAHASLTRPSSAAKPCKKARKLDDDAESDDEDQTQKMEALSNKDAIILPITAGIVLTILYFLIKWYGAEIINLIMGYYFAGVGVFSVAKLLNDTCNLIINFVFPNYFRYRPSGSNESCVVKVATSEQKVIRQDNNHQISRPSSLPSLVTGCLWTSRSTLQQKYNIKAYVHNVFELDTKATVVNVVSALAGLGTIIYVNTIAKPWYLTNLQGFAVSYSALQLVSPTSFVTGSLILSALFFYDIWAVFFTPLMVGVAKNLDQPIKLVFPGPDEPSSKPGEPPIKSFSMLGLGDIVIPGIVIGLALRFDLYMFYLQKQKKAPRKREGNSVPEKARYVPVTGHWGDWFWTLGSAKDLLPPRLKISFPKPYFKASMAGYVTGMVTTLAVMSVFNHAQPALLYLVPGVLLSLWGTALFKGQIKHMWEFSEAITAEPTEDNLIAQADTAKTKPEGNASKGLFERLWSEIWTSNGEDEIEQKARVAKEEKSKSPKAKQTTETSVSKPSTKSDRSNVLVAFSVTRYVAKLSSPSQLERTNVSIGSKTSASPVASDSSEDVVVVSPRDADDAPEEATVSRMRTRSTRRGQA